MKSKFNVDRDFCSTTQQSYNGVSPLASNQPGHTWQFVNDVQGLLGDEGEPDPLFFVESWALGVPAAIENWQQRRRGHSNGEHQSQGYCELDGIPTSMFGRDSFSFAEFHSWPGTGATAGRYDTSWSQQSTEDSAKWTQDHVSQTWETYAEECENGRDTVRPMTQLRACQLLGVTATSTLKEIKAAYRRKVSQWHPDRLENRTNEVRQFATKQMAAINEAYRLMRSALI